MGQDALLQERAERRGGRQELSLIHPQSLNKRKEVESGELESAL